MSKLINAVSVLMFCVSLAIGADDNKPVAELIRIPGGVKVEEKTPPVKVKTVTPITITADTVFMFDSDVDLLVLSSPEGYVKITEEQGPIRIRGKFADEPGKTQKREYKGKEVYTVEGVKDGKVELIVVPLGGAVVLPDDVIRRTITVQLKDAAPAPKPPTPQPPTPQPPVPQPKLDDAPVNTDGLHVAFVYETGPGGKLSNTQFAIMYGAKTRTWLDANCDKAGNQSQYRLLDKDQVPQSEPWKDVIANRKRDTIPWAVVMSGRKYVDEFALGTLTEDQFIQRVSKHKK